MKKYSIYFMLLLIANFFMCIAIHEKQIRQYEYKDKEPKNVREVKNETKVTRTDYFIENNAFVVEIKQPIEHKLIGEKLKYEYILHQRTWEDDRGDIQSILIGHLEGDIFRADSKNRIGCCLGDIYFSNTNNNKWCCYMIAIPLFPLFIIDMLRAIDTKEKTGEKLETIEISKWTTYVPKANYEVKINIGEKTLKYYTKEDGKAYIPINKLIDECVKNSEFTISLDNTNIDLTVYDEVRQSNKYKNFVSLKEKEIKKLEEIDVNKINESNVSYYKNFLMKLEKQKGKEKYRPLLNAIDSVYYNISDRINEIEERRKNKEEDCDSIFERDRVLCLCTRECEKRNSVSCDNMFVYIDMVYSTNKYNWGQMDWAAYRTIAVPKLKEMCPNTFNKYMRHKN